MRETTDAVLLRLFIGESDEFDAAEPMLDSCLVTLEKIRVVRYYGLGTGLA
jgi:hypothetical protein